MTQSNLSQFKILLAIESSCDETAAAVIDRRRQVLSTVVASQAALHERFGGVVPEIASRAHVQRILPVIDEALSKAQVDPTDIDVVAVATEPGLVGSLLVGLTAAKSLALAWNLPLVAVDHIKAHLYACQMSADTSVFPAVGLVVSGGHTNLYDCRSAVEMKLLGSTIDDAAGEAFDKVAQILGLGYPGGPEVSRAAEAGDPDAFKFPRVFLRDDDLKFSFSGLKTAVLYAAHGVPGAKASPPPERTAKRVADLAASFQAAVVDVLVGKCEQALQQTGHRQLLVGGGVAANGRLREQLRNSAARHGYTVHVAAGPLCTDNAAMAAIAWEQIEAGQFATLDIDVNAGLVRAARI